jgi:hypothetical protein
MASKKTRKILRGGLGLAASTIAQVALEEAVEDPRVRRKAKKIAASTGRALKRTAKKVARRGRKTGPKKDQTTRRKKATRGS